VLLRSGFICCYLVTAYWFSHHYQPMKMAFYPTLGAFCFLFMNRGGHLQHTARIIFGASISAGIGSIFYLLDSGAVSFFLTTAITLTLIHVCKWNAAPIMAVSLIPFFAHPSSFWVLPLAVLLSLSALLGPIWLIDRIERSGKLTFVEAYMSRFAGRRTEMKQDF
jgi:hypothetical protein